MTKKGYGLSGPYQGIYMVTTPMPFPLKASNGFIGEGDSGWIVIDGGVSTTANKQIWDQALQDIGINWRQVDAIYLTHYHHDHIGLAGWMQQQAESAVYITEADGQMTEKLLLSSAEDYISRFNYECDSHGWDEELLPQLARDVASISALLNPLPQLSIIPAQISFNLGGLEVRTKSTPGHTDGHQCFLADDRILFSGDNLLAAYNLHATDWPHNLTPNPLQHFLKSMVELENLPIEQVLPGHGPVFSNFRERLHLLYQHHLTRMNKVLEELNQPQTAWQLACRVFPDADYIHIKRLILAETLAYLQFLESADLVGCAQETNVVIYYPIPGISPPTSVQELLNHS